MPTDQDLPLVWPVARSFHPGSVPLPLHQEWLVLVATPPGKFANAELMKIPNFLHLTPPASQASKKFCSEWLKELDTNEKIENHLPITITTSDYLHSSPSLRDARSRIVTFQVKSSSLKSYNHAKDKLLRLVKERYTIVSEQCPLRMQNFNYAMYLLNVFVSESWKTEPWEDEKCEADMEKYVWEGSQSQPPVEQLLQRMPDKEKAQDMPDVIEQYAAYAGLSCMFA
ncbi:28S ribosomal protein S35, mitochondrial-like [Daphnia pulex]|uniref:28S ribosomal protein S35, mitochondrial-like n=1 Tax=Daphnia pulex TaxID=6669 RepID=UPI001EDF30B9|nr:28S ribosomal protein S35, mitochondrial-like [Daphnia pulex]XP_046446242.1 28S ribosomal protein S35, mitochondrial-like [Daphnia pulex]